MERTSSVATHGDARAGSPAAVTVFVCVNCARPGQPWPALLDFAWPIPVRHVLVPCTGRLQPEQVLRAFESGADAVCAVACKEDNCHYVQGSKRCAHRVDYLRSILQEIGLGAERLMLFSLPGTAAQDMVGKPAPANGNRTVEAQVAAIRDQVMQALEGLSSNPLREPPPAEDSNREVDASYDDREQ